MSSIIFSRKFKGATINLFQIGGSEYPEIKLKKRDASSPYSSLQVNIPQSVYMRAVLPL